MESVGIIGVGLIGGSFALALRAAGFDGRIAGVSSENTIRQALDLKAIDCGVSLEQAAAECDLLYLAQPISTIRATLEQLGEFDREGCLITDAGSTKVEIVRTAQRHIRRAQFLGGHPMAGKESRGVAAACSNLFEDRPYILTPNNPQETGTPQVSGLISWLKRCGANVITLDPEEHDRSVAFISHLPQMSSTALAACLQDSGDVDKLLQLAGPGLIDMSRLALSSYDIWKDIVATNSRNIEHALGVYIDKLTELRHNLHTQSLGNAFNTAAGIAQRIRKPNNR